mgnify:CR=1 FL=1
MAAKKREDRTGDGAPLTNNPFAALGGPETAPVLPPAPVSPPTVKKPATPSLWRVEQARKGGWKLSLVKRAGGRSATVLAGVQGDAEALVKALRKLCGAGGAVTGPDAVEIQGDQRQSIADWLDKRGGEG